MTDAERLLWRYLRMRQLEQYKFRRQYPIGSYIADFVCVKAGLIVELDGGQHATAAAKDAARTAALAKRGFRVLRFWNHEVLTNIEGVVAVIERELVLKPPHPNPPPEGEGTKRPLPLQGEGGDGGGCKGFSEHQ